MSATMTETMTETIDPTDKQYQVSDDHAPDKAAMWLFPAEKDGWTLAHNALRGEMHAITEALEAIKGRPLLAWEVAAIQKAEAGHSVHVHAHHENEDALFVPELCKRFHYPEKLEADHTMLLDKLQAAERLIQSLSEGDMVDNVLTAWIAYESSMKPHLKEEEALALPLFRAYFTPAEAAPLVQKILANGPPIEMGSFIYFMGVQKFRAEFMKQHGIPGFVWHADFNTKYKGFLKDFITPLEALKTGKEPEENGGMCAIQ